MRDSRKRILRMADTPASKMPTLFTPSDAPVFRFAGLWSAWADDAGTLVFTCTILTTEANQTMAPFHHRMPVLLSEAGADIWLDCATAPDAPGHCSAVHRTMRFSCAGFQRVNNVRHDDPSCWNPAPTSSDNPRHRRTAMSPPLIVAGRFLLLFVGCGESADPLAEADERYTQIMVDLAAADRDNTRDIRNREAQAKVAAERPRRCFDSQRIQNIIREASESDDPTVKAKLTAYERTD